jgi:hypothetical protein
MTLDARARATALKLLAKFGKLCTFKSAGAATYDPATGANTASTTSFPVKLYLDTPNKAELDGGQVVVTDSVALIAAKGLPVNPKINDYITVDNKDRQVKMVNAVWSGELVALWRLGLAS